MTHMQQSETTHRDNSVLHPFNMAGGLEPIYLKEKIGQQIFIYGEYLKRKFFIDCNYKKNNGVYVKDKNKYDKLEFNEFKNLVNNIESIFEIKVDRGAIFIDNAPVYKKYFKKYKNIYKIIFHLYKLGYLSLKYKLLSNRSRNIHFPYINQEYKFDYKTRAECYLSPYIYERAMNCMAHWEKMGNIRNTEFSVFVDLLAYNFRMCVNIGTYKIYEELVSKYHLYMCNLIDMCDPSKIISEHYKVPFLPRFFNLPKLALESHKLKDRVKSQSNPMNKLLTLSLDFSEPLRIEEVSEFAKNIITYYAYNYRESHKSDMEQSDYIFISYYLDSANPHSTTSKFEDRIDGLYLWDNLYRHNSDKTASNEIQIFLRKIKNKEPNSALIRKYQKILKNATECIEKGQILPIA